MATWFQRRRAHRRLRTHVGLWYHPKYRVEELGETSRVPGVEVDRAEKILGALSVEGLVRPKQIHIVGRDLDGNEIEYEADELEARMFQHEMDHIDGTLLIERLDDDTRKAALKTLRDLQIGQPETPKPAGGGLTLP